ncbi:hypothetical protein JTB14_016960 [Gonioctena quinquepunctata]|nr:hypothetical protein JTB14_016960 [Gonioctena quinquepunctata]
MEEIKTARKSLGVRHVQILFMHLLLAIAVGMRVQLSVAIVAMTDSKTSPNPDVPVYDWNNKSVILSSFYWGYVVLQVVAAELGRKYGPKRFLVAAMAISASVVMLIPLMADKFGSYGVMGCRVVIGLVQGCFYASVQNVVSKWTPRTESSRLTTLAYAGAPLGTIITMPLVGYISSSWVGWPCTFYLYGALGFTWVVFYSIFGANSPQDHRSISKLEKNYIEKYQDVDGSKRKIPWKSMFTSLPVWAIIFVQIGSIWGYTTLLTEMPNYMNKVLGFDIQSNGILSALPYFISFILTFVIAHIADYIMNHNYLSRTWTRKILTAMSTIGPATTLIVFGYLPEDASDLTVALLMATIGIQGMANSGYIANKYDLSPNFAGIIMGVCNSTGNLFSIFGPILVQVVVTDETDKTQWRIIFLVAAILYMTPNIFFLLFASGEKQPWDSPDADEANATEERRKQKISVISMISL